MDSVTAEEILAQEIQATEAILQQELEAMSQDDETLPPSQQGTEMSTQTPRYLDRISADSE